MSQGKADLCKLTQHAHELVLVDDPPVGPLALEGDHSGHWPTGLRSRQICTQPRHCQANDTSDPLNTQVALSVLCCWPQKQADLLGRKEGGGEGVGNRVGGVGNGVGGVSLNSKERLQLLTVLLVDESSEGLRILSGQEGFDPSCEDISHHQGPLKGHPLIGAITLQGRRCRPAHRLHHIGKKRSSLGADQRCSCHWWPMLHTSIQGGRSWTHTQGCWLLMLLWCLAAVRAMRPMQSVNCHSNSIVARLLTAGSHVNTDTTQRYNSYTVSKHVIFVQSYCHKTQSRKQQNKSF